MRFNLLKPETILYLCPVLRIKRIWRRSTSQQFPYLSTSSSSFYAICKSNVWECEISGIKTKILPSNKNTACFSSQKNRLNELYFITLVLILLLFRPHRLLECLVKTTHSINYSIINKYNLNRTHTPLVSLTFLKWVTFIILTFYSLVLKRH